MRLSSESFEAEQKKFALGSFHELNMRLSEIHVPSGWIIWQPDTSTLNFVNLTSTQPIIVQNSLSIDHTLHVSSYHHGTESMMQISDLPSEICYIVYFRISITEFTAPGIWRKPFY